MRMPAGQQPLARVGFAGARHLVPVRLPSGGRDVPINVRVIDLNADAMDNIMEVWDIFFSDDVGTNPATLLGITA